VILLFDEDIGTKIPKALKLVGIKNVKSMADSGFGLGKPDVEWLKSAAQNDWLIFSCNKHMLDVPEERDTIIAEKVGIVFLTSGQEYLREVLRLLLNKWGWLEFLDQKISRPFAYYLYPYGRTRQVL
jgi:hypothetical protein